MRRALLVGLLLWIAGTTVIRLTGERLIAPHNWLRAVVLYLISFVPMALLVPRICRRLKLEKDAWFRAVTLLILPTLMLDPFSCVFFASVFPNLDADAAGVFGGWMLACCGGAVAGVWIER